MPAMRLLRTSPAERRCGAARCPALSNTPDSRSNRALRPPNASRARTFASSCSMTCGGTAVASESKLQGRMSCPISALEPSGSRQWNSSYEPTRNTSRPLDCSSLHAVRVAIARVAAASRRPDRPFSRSEVATFDSPWAMDFLPGTSSIALVTEKPGRIWLVDVATGQKQPVAGAPAGPSVEPRRTARRRFLSRLSHRPARLSDLLRAIVERWQRARSGSRRAGSRRRRRRATRRLHGPLARSRRRRGRTVRRTHRLRAGRQSLFLSSGERQRFTPAQDPSQPLGKILHLTLDGKPAPGNPMAGQTGAATVTITDPPEDTEAAKNAAGRRSRGQDPI